MKTVLALIFCALSVVPAFSNSSCSSACAQKYINELGLVVTLKGEDLKNYISASNIAVNPLTSGFSSGFQIGRHKIINEKATLGVVVGTNAFVSSGETSSQIYQLGAQLTGRLYFGETWRNGVFAELAAGPEFAASSIQGGDFQFQANIGSRVGLGYNYQFNENVTLGLSFVVSPTILSGSYLNGSKAVINMLW